jgi:hypothetical protein
LQRCGNRLAQRQNAGVGGVFGLAILNGGDGGVFGELRRVEIRLAGAEIDHIFSAPPQLADQIGERQRLRWLNASS